MCTVVCYVVLLVNVIALVATCNMLMEKIHSPNSALCYILYGQMTINTPHMGEKAVHTPKRSLIQSSHK